jgi:hypothetical protein
VKSLKRRKALKKGLGIERATDILWTLNHPRTYILLVQDRGWTAQQYERWLGDITISELLA